MWVKAKMRRRKWRSGINCLCGLKQKWEGVI